MGPPQQRCGVSKKAAFGSSSTTSFVVAKKWCWASTVRVPRETLGRVWRALSEEDGATIQFRVVKEPSSSSLSSLSSSFEKNNTFDDGKDDEEEEGKKTKKKKADEMVVSVVKISGVKGNDADGSREEYKEEEEIARFESRENELVPGDLCETIEDDKDGATATVVAKLSRKFHRTRDETAKNQAGAKCKTRTDMLVAKKNEKFNTKLLGNDERKPEEDATATTTTTTKVIREALIAAKGASAEIDRNNDGTNTTKETLALQNNATTTSNGGGRIGAEELERMAKRRISLVRATILLAESKNSESLVVLTANKVVEKECVNKKPLTSAAMNSETVCRECILSLLHERKLSKDALREAIVRGFEHATKLNRKKQLREQILETPLRDTFERVLKEVANFRAPGRYELKRGRVEEGRRANASASLWIAQEEDATANAPIVVNRKRVRVDEVDEGDKDDSGMKKKNDVLTPPLLLESLNRKKEEAARKKQSMQGSPQAVSPVYQPEELVQRAIEEESSSSDDDDDDDSRLDDDSETNTDSDSDASALEDSETHSSDNESESEEENVRKRARKSQSKPSFPFLTDDPDVEWQSFESSDGKAVLKLFKRIGRNKIRPITEEYLDAWRAVFDEYWSIRRRLNQHCAKINLCEDHIEIYENFSSKKEKKRNQTAFEKSKSDLIRLRAPEAKSIRARMRKVTEDIERAFGGKTREKIERFAQKLLAVRKEREKRVSKKKKPRGRGADENRVQS